jgi:hypothetical protein
VSGGWIRSDACILWIINVKIREYSSCDLDVLQEFHRRQGFAYDFPDPSRPLFVSRLVLETSGRVRMALLARLTAEMYLMTDPLVGTPRDRWRWFLTLHRAAERDLCLRGLEDAHCWLPPRIVKHFGRRLTRLGWCRDDYWVPYCRGVFPTLREMSIDKRGDQDV